MLASVSAAASSARNAASPSAAKISATSQPGGAFDLGVQVHERHSEPPRELPPTADLPAPGIPTR